MTISINQNDQFLQLTLAVVFCCIVVLISEQGLVRVTPRSSPCSLYHPCRILSRKTIIATLFLRQIFNLSKYYSITFSDLIATTLTYCIMITISAESEVERVVARIRQALLSSF